MHERGKKTYSVLVETLEGKRQFGRRHADGRAVFVWIRIGTSGGSYEHSSGSSDYIKDWAFLVQIGDC
jgi:hypothetical protein